MDTLKLPSPKKQIDASVIIPGSKSFTNRALICAILADGVSTLDGFSISKDSAILVKALQQLGVRIEYLSKDKIKVYGTGGHFEYTKKTIHVGPAGTVMRFLTTLCALIPGEFELRGSKRMHQRPIGDLVDALHELGAEIGYLEKDGCPPLRISGKTLHGRKIKLKGQNSSQFLTSLLLSSPLLEKLEIEMEGELVSTSYVDMTLQTMNNFGVHIKRTNHGFKPKKAKYTGKDYLIEPDLSGATYFWAMGALSGKIRVENVNPNSLQGDIMFPDLLEKMGCEVSRGENFIEVGNADLRSLQGIECNMELLPDTAQTLAVVAAFAQGETKITGLSTLKKKETDRLAAMQTELAKMDIKTEIGADFIIIHGGTPKAAQIATYEDHRMAMAFAVAATKLDGMKIEEPDVVEKSFPNFWEKLFLINAPKDIKPQICTVVMGKTLKEFLKNLKKHQTVSDFIELRVDYIKDFKKKDISKIKENVTKTAIFTCRRKDEGGHFQGTEEERLEILQSASNLFDYIDIELQTLESNPGIISPLGLNRVISWHNFEKTPDLEAVFERMKKFNPGVYKIISTAHTFSDTTKIFQLLMNHSDKKIIALSMGEIGQYTRKLAPLLGGFLTFATLDGEASAAGQMELEELRKFYDYDIPKHA